MVAHYFYISLLLKNHIESITGIVVHNCESAMVPRFTHERISKEMPIIFFIPKASMVAVWFPSCGLRNISYQNQLGNDVTLPL